MASNYPKNDFYKRVINKNRRTFLHDLDPTATVDIFLETEYLTVIQCRDISELPNSSEKIRSILDHVSRKGPAGYVKFKDCLRKSHQAHLSDILKATEKELTGKKTLSKPHKEKREEPRRVQVLYQRVDNAAMTTLSEKHLREIARNVLGDNWELLAPFLGVNDNVVATIKANCPNDREKQIFDMLIKWKQQADPPASFVMLQKAIHEAPDSVYANMNALNDIIENRVPENSEPVEDRMDGLSLSEPSQTEPFPPEPSQPEPAQPAEPSALKNLFDNPNEEKGRLKILDGKPIEEIKWFCTHEIGRGGFGTVYRSNGKIPGINIDVAVKIINDTEAEKNKMKSITNEILASRTMHFAIVPLLAYGEDNNGSFYFMTPYLSNGNLNAAIEEDKKLEDEGKLLKMDMAKRVKILYHVASAVHFLHTSVENYRGKIVHMDIKTLNIVLDENYNARLIDFGLARELEEGAHSTETTQWAGTQGYFQGKPCVKGDYYNYGVVIRELLTGNKPKTDNEELGKLTDNNIKEKTMAIWKENNKPFPVTEELIILSSNCLANSLDESQGETSETILEKVEKLIIDSNNDRWHRDNSQKKCHLCMQYDTVDDTFLKHDAACQIKVCVSCMRHSYCNPIVCHSCGKKIIPSIGHGWNAVLIAGDDDNEEVFSDDVDKMKKVITSKFPLVMGISSDDVKVIKAKDYYGSSSSGKSMKEELMEGLRWSLTKPTETDGVSNLRTTVWYYSGHCTQERGFKLGGPKEEYLSEADLQGLITGNDAIPDAHTDADTENRLIILFDCCHAPQLNPGNRKDIKIAQLNASDRTNVSNTENIGSFFQRLITQALTGRALSTICTDIIDGECTNCYGDIKGDLVSLFDLQTYITKHIRNEPAIINTPGVKTEHLYIGYVIRYEADLEFQFEFDNNSTITRRFPQKMFQDMAELRTVLFDDFMKERQKNLEKPQPQLSTTYFRDMLSIHFNTGSKTKQIQELNTIENVNMAWDARRSLHVSFRRPENASLKLVGVFFENNSIVEEVVQYLNDEGIDPKKPDRNVVKYVIEWKMFLEQMKKEETNDQKQMKKVLLEIDQSSKFPLEETNLCVSFPSDENFKPSYWENFIGLRLEKKKKPNNHQSP